MQQELKLYETKHRVMKHHRLKCDHCEMKVTKHFFPVVLFIVQGGSNF